MELPDEAVEKIYTGIFNKFFPEFVNLFVYLSVFDHEGNHLKGWMGNPNEYYNNIEANQEVNAYLHQMMSSIYWQKVPNEFKVAFIQLT